MSAAGLPLAATMFTAQQRAAVESEGSVVVRAGAGSGKTAVLVERYVRLLCGDGRDDVPTVPLELEQILAVTFTEKAAAEMRDRIRTSLAARAGAATAAARARLVRMHRGLAAARIGTIHALAARLVRTAPLESGVRPDARVLDEIDAAAWVEREVRRALLTSLRAGDPDVRRCADAWGFGGRGGDLVSTTVGVLATLGRRGLPAAALAAALPCQEAAVAAAASNMRVAIRAVIACIDGWLASGTRDTAAVGRFRERWREWRARLDALDAGGDVAALLALRDFQSVARRAFRDRDGWATCGEALTFQPQDGTPRFGGTIAAAFGCVQGLPLAAAFTRVVAGVDAALAGAKRRDGVLTFDDLISGARALVRDHPAAAARLTRDVRAILVDEFQDTDPAQVDLLRRLAAGGAELFAVGDEKQSIYRFRGAEVQLFGELRAALGRERALADNFRSLPPVVAFVNGFAARLFVGGAPPQPWRVCWSPEQRLRARRVAGDDDARPAIRLKSLVNDIEAGALLAREARALEARVVAATIAELAGEGWRPGDVAVLLPALTQVKAYEFALRRWGIPYEVVRGHGFYECQEVRDLLYLLGAVVDPFDGVALAGALRSPLFGVSDETLARLAAASGGLCMRLTTRDAFADVAEHERGTVEVARDLFAELRAACDRVGAADLLTRALEVTRLEGVLFGQFHGAQKVANVRKLVAQARALERRGWTSAREFAAQARRLVAGASREPEAPRLGGDADAVRVMTIHQAKGLEFPVVILPDLGREMPRDYRSPVAVDAKYGLLASATFGAGRFRLPHRLIDAWRAAERDRGDAERARLLYVACTRARNLLILCEGKGRRAALAAPEADAPANADGERSACEQIWGFLGRAAVADFVAGSDERAVVEAPGEDADGAPVAVRVELEKSAALLARVPPPVVDVVDERIARALEVEPSADDRRAVAAVLDAPLAMATSLVVSPTALADFARCPRQYWYRHVRGVPEEMPLRRESRGAAASRLGSAAHAALETLDLKVAASARPAAVGAALAGASGLDASERATVARDLVAALARAEAHDGDLRLLGREVSFFLRLAGDGARGEAASPMLFIRGRIDLLAERGTRLLIRDYKYATPGGDAEAHRVQLEIYALAVAAAHPRRALDAEIEWLRAPGGRVALPLDVGAARARVEGLGVALADATATRATEAFPMQYGEPTPCRALGCAFVARCFPAASPPRRGPHDSRFRASPASASMRS